MDRRQASASLDTSKNSNFGLSSSKEDPVTLIDSHCHLHDREFYTTKQAEECLERARIAGVKKVVCIGTSHEDSRAACEFAASHENVYWTYGIHPENTGQGSTTFEPCSKKQLVAIGEVGLDYHYDGYDRDAQIRLFEQMLQLAIDNNLPVSFHIREAFEDFFPVVANFSGLRGVVHSFTDSKKVLRRILEETDFYIGVNGLATYSTLPLPPLDRILLETDAPFLAPVPHRGEPNEPAYIAEIAKWLSFKLEIPSAEVAKVTTTNTTTLFALDD